MVFILLITVITIGILGITILGIVLGDIVHGITIPGITIHGGITHIMDGAVIMDMAITLDIMTILKIKITTKVIGDQEISPQHTAVAALALRPAQEKELVQKVGLRLNRAILKVEEVS